MFLLDTNVLSELIKPRPDERVVVWAQNQSNLDLAVSVLTLGELVKGVRTLTSGSRRRQLEQWIGRDLSEQFTGRLLPVTEQIAVTWGRLAADGQAKGRELHVVDGLLIATAIEHRLTLVTRNVADFVNRGARVFDPWKVETHG